jgi:hypothetical protein
MYADGAFREGNAPSVHVTVAPDVPAPTTTGRRDRVPG